MAGTPNRYYSAVAQDTTLSGPAVAGATFIAVTATTGFPTTYPYTLALDWNTSLEELVDVTSATGLTLSVNRAVDSTAATGHGAGAVVRHVLTARDIREAQQHIVNNTGVHGVTGNVVGTTDVQIVTNKDFSSPTNLFVMQDKGGQVFNVKAYGALGNGVADDSSAIQSAINAAQLFNGAYGAYGSTVFFPAGAYKLIASGLTVGGNGITLQGSGQLSTVIFVNNNATITPITVSGTGATPGNVSTYSNDVVIKDLLVTMSFAAGPIGAGNNTKGISLSYVVRPKLINVSITNFGICLYLLGTVSAKIDKLSINSSYATVTTLYGVKVDNATQNASCAFTNCNVSIGSFTGTTSYAWFFQGAHCADLYVRFCEGDGATNGFYFDGSGAVAGSDLIDIHFYQIVADQCVTGMNILNVAENAGQIQIDGIYHAPSTNNGFGLVLSNASGVHVRGAEFFSNVKTGCNGFYVTNSKDFSISQSNVKGNYQNFYNVNASSYGSISNCNAFATSSVGSSMGISLSGSNNITMNSNTFRAIATFSIRYGIYGDATCSKLIGIGNNFDLTTVTSAVVLATGSTLCKFSNNNGLNPAGSAIPGTAFVIAGSTGAAFNNTGVDGTLYVTAIGAVTGVSINGVAISGTVTVGESYRLAAGGNLILTYTVAPTLIFVGD